MYPACALHLHLVHMHYAAWTYAVDDLYLHIHMRPVVCMNRSTSCIMHMGMVNGRGYDDQQKCTVCDICRPCHSILSTLKPVFRHIQQIRCAYNSLRCLDLQIWLFCVHDDDDRTDYFTPCACGRGNNIGSL